MASIPLVALNVRTPEQPDIMQKYGQLMQLRICAAAEPDAAAGGAAAPSGASATDDRSADCNFSSNNSVLKDQQATSAAMQNWDGKDYNDILPLVLKNGGSAQAVIGLKKSILDQQVQVANAAKATGQGAEAQIAATLKKNDLVNGALSPLIDPTKIPDAQLPQALTSTVQSLVQQGALDPPHAQAASQLLQSGDPTTIRNGIQQFTNTLRAGSQITEEALKKAQTGQQQAETDKIRASTDPTSPLYSPSAAAVAMGTAPGAAQIQAGEAQQAGRKAAAEESARMPGEMALAQQRQALSQGDPVAAAKLLVNRDATLSELKSRGATPDFIARTLFAAKQLSGGKYNAQAEDANFSVAKSPANVGFFGSAKSLTEQGGTLDQLTNAAKDIPGNQIPVFNTIADVAKAAAGSGPIAKYASILLGVSDDYSKVMGGGQGKRFIENAGSPSLFQPMQSPEARAAAIEGIRGAVGSQIHSRIGSNPVLQRMYGDEIQAGAPASGGMVTVQIPGSPPGQIPAAGLAKFKADHPNAQVQQ